MDPNKPETPTSSQQNNNENDSSDNDDDFVVIRKFRANSENRTNSNEENIRYEFNEQLADSYHSNYFGRDLIGSANHSESISDEPIQQPNETQSTTTEHEDQLPGNQISEKDLRRESEEDQAFTSIVEPVEKEPQQEIEQESTHVEQLQQLTLDETPNEKQPQQEIELESTNVEQLQQLTLNETPNEKQPQQEIDQKSTNVEQLQQLTLDETPNEKQPLEIPSNAEIVEDIADYQTRRQFFQQISANNPLPIKLNRSSIETKKVDDAAGPLKNDALEKETPLKAPDVTPIDDQKQLPVSSTNVEQGEQPELKQLYDKVKFFNEQGLKYSKILNLSPSHEKLKKSNKIEQDDILCKNDQIPVPKERNTKKNITEEDKQKQEVNELEESSDIGQKPIAPEAVTQEEEDEEDRHSVASFASCHSSPEVTQEVLTATNPESNESHEFEQKPSSLVKDSYITLDQVPTKTCQSLGRKIKLADLYDSFIDEGCWKNIFHESISLSTIKFQEIDETTISKPLSNNLRERLDALNVEDHLALSLLSKFTNISGYGKFVTDVVSSSNYVKVTISSVYIHCKRKETLEIFNPEVLSKVNVEEVFKTNATDIVVGVESGVVIPFSLCLESSHPEKNLEFEEELKGYMKIIIDILNGIQLDYDKTQISTALQGKISLEIYTGAEQPEVIGKIQTLQHATAFIRDAISRQENRPNTPISFTLLSLETLSSYIDCDVKNPLKQYEPRKFAKDIINAFSTTYELLSKADALERYLQSNANFLSDNALNEAYLSILTWKDKEGAFIDQMRQLVEKIRRGDQEESMLLPVLNGVNKLVEEIAAWVQLDRSSTFEKVRVFSEIEKNGLKVYGKNMDWISIVGKLKECIVFFSSSVSPGFDPCLREALRLKNEGYQTILVDQETCVEKLPYQNRLCYYVNGTCVQDDLLKEMNHENKFCIVQKKDGCQSVTCIKPKEAVYLLLTCPLACSDEAKTWFCLDCRDVISYGFDEHFYCKCGRSAVYNFLFRCDHPNHGKHYVDYEKDVLEKILGEIEPHKTLNVLILGETGVGKSTFINAFANYLTFSSLDQAYRSELVCLIPSRFVLTQKQGKELKEVEVKIGDSPNENLKTGESSTQSPHGLIFEAKNWNKTIRLIDTPGIADIRGTEQDDKNFETILRFIENIDELHSIVILLRPNSARLNVTFKYCIGELLSHLHISATKNIVFCFTNAGAARYDFGDTVPILRRYLGELEQTRGVKISLNEETIYSFENEAFRFLCGCKSNVQYEQREFERHFNNSKESWNLAEEETLRLLKHICALPPHPVRDSVSVNTARRIILTLAKPLAEITENIQDNVSAIERRRAEMDGLDGTEADLTERLRIPQISVEAVELNYPRTVCTADCCIETRSVGNSNAHRTIYITHCHSHCLLPGVESDIIRNTKILECVAIDFDKCRNCGCSWETHMHITYDQKIKETMVEDPTVQRQIEVNRDNRAAIEAAIDKCEQEIAQYQREQDEIMQISIKFGSFIKRFCMIPYNDAYEDYVKHLIRNEEHRAAHIRDEAKIARMKELIKTYAANKQIIENTGHANAEVIVNLEDINRAIQHLFTLRLTGKKIQQFFNTANIANIHNYQRIEKRFQMPKIELPENDDEIWKLLQNEGTMFSLDAKIELTKALFQKMSAWITNHHKKGTRPPIEEDVLDESESDEEIAGPSTKPTSLFSYFPSFQKNEPVKVEQKEDGKHKSSKKKKKAKAQKLAKHH